jgi:hypothetical protein
VRVIRVPLIDLNADVFFLCTLALHKHEAILFLTLVIAVVVCVVLKIFALLVGAGAVGLWGRLQYQMRRPFWLLLKILVQTG